MPRRTRTLHFLLALFTVATLAATFFVNSTTTAQASPATSNSINVQVDHAVQIRNGGLVVINDTVRLSTEPGVNVEPLKKFLLGFPFVYRSNLTYVYCYDASDQQLDVKLDVGLGMIGFFGVEVSFPQSVNMSNGEHYEFTVVFVFSDLISSEILPWIPDAAEEIIPFTFNATFPAYPSLSQTASTVNLTVALPNNVRFVSSSFSEEEDIKFTNSTFGVYQIYNYTKKDLAAFTYEPIWLEFEGSHGDFTIIEVEKIKRDITVDSWKHVLMSDAYELVPKAGNLSELSIQLPQGAFEVSALDEFEKPFKKGSLRIEQETATTPIKATLIFSPPHIPNKLARFRLTYKVPWEKVISQSDWQNYNTTLASFDNFNWIIRELVVALTLPEGAEFTHLLDLGVVQKSAFQETMTFVYYNVTPFQDFFQEATYEYTVFWASFRPTLWVGTAAVILSVLALLWHAPRPAAPIPTIPVRPEELKSYVDAYEQKRLSLSKLETLEERARKRKIPRRRYKVRKRTLESRLSVLSKDLARLRDKLQRASPKYADMMRQIEIAEADIEGIEAGIRRTETRYRRGEISTAAYHKLLEDYYRRRERARTTIDGILIRLREEIA